MVGYVPKMKTICTLLLLLITLPVKSQEPDSLAMANLAEAIDKLQSGELLQQGHLGFALSVAETGELLLSQNAGKSFPPASTLKLVTTATALEVLGENFTFPTYLEYDGTLTDGVLAGNLYIYGTGDPTLGSPRFKEKTDSATVFHNWLAALQNAGIHRIEGRILADNSYFDDEHVESSWSWGDVGHYYGTGVSGINWNENACHLFFKAGPRPGTPATLVRSRPVQPEIRYDSRVMTGLPGSGNKTHIRPDLLSRSLIIEGTVPRVRGEYPIRAAIFNPPLLVAQLFTEFLNRNSVPVSQEASTHLRVESPANRKRIHTYHSPALAEICKQINWWSINLYAEAVYKTLGKKLGNQTSFRETGPAIISHWALRGINVKGMHIKDGSGLAAGSSLTPQNLVEVLNAATRQNTFQVFLSTLPIAGEAGTVRNRRFGNKGNVRIKSGSIEGTRAYAGYVMTRSRTLLSFVINAHRYPPEAGTEVARELARIVNLISEL